MQTVPFTSAGTTYRMTVNPAAAAADGKPEVERHPLIVLLHGNYGLGAPYGDQIHDFARSLASHGYVTAVPGYYADDKPHLTDSTPHDRTLADAIVALAAHADCDTTRLGLIGYSLGAATAMTYIATRPPGTVKAFADHFGFLTPAIKAGVARFPPTIIFHNRNDRVVPVQQSSELDGLLPPATAHRFVTPYDEQWQELNHAFKPGGPADADSRSKTTEWFAKYLPPVGIPRRKNGV